MCYDTGAAAACAVAAASASSLLTCPPINPHLPYHHRLFFHFVFLHLLLLPGPVMLLPLSGVRTWGKVGLNVYIQLLLIGFFIRLPVQDGGAEKAGGIPTSLANLQVGT